MKKEILIIFITAFVSIVAPILFDYFFGKHVYIQYSSVYLSDGKYQNIIIVNNSNHDKSIDKIGIKIKDNININNVVINGEKNSIEDNYIMIKSIKPKEVYSIVIESNEELDENRIFVDSNKELIELSNYNKKSNMNYFYIVLIVAYAIIMLVSTKNLYKYLDNETKKLNIQIEDLKKESAEIDKNIEEMHNKKTASDAIYLRELTGLEMENEFYKSLLLSKCDKTINAELLDKMISKKLRTFNKKKIKYMTYSDIYNILVRELYETNKNK